MRGSRVKALRLQFTELHGRAPSGPKVELAYTSKGIPAAKPTRQAGWNPSGRIRSRITERFLRAIFSVKVLQPSEWRQWKKRHSLPDSQEAIARRSFQRLRQLRAIDDNNLRIKGYSHHNQAHGKMKRAGVFATRRRS